MKKKKVFKTAIVLGSGGHTTEMFKLLGGMDMDSYKPREYIVADTDAMSLQKVKHFETNLKSNELNFDYKVSQITRSRHVGQSYLTSILTTLLAFLSCFSLANRLSPDVLLINGPGTCIPLAFLIYFFSIIKQMFGKTRAKIIFVESICRVKTLSLTGKILYHLRIADSFIVQWPELLEKYPKASYLGRLV